MRGAATIEKPANCGDCFTKISNGITSINTMLPTHLYDEECLSKLAVTSPASPPPSVFVVSGANPQYALAVAPLFALSLTPYTTSLNVDGSKSRRSKGARFIERDMESPCRTKIVSVADSDNDT